MKCENCGEEFDVYYNIIKQKTCRECHSVQQSGMDRREFDGSAIDTQVGGDHYRRFKIQPIEFIEANGLTYTEGRVIEYVCRRRFKGQGRQDVEKAIHYLQMLLEREYADDEQKEREETR